MALRDSLFSHSAWIFRTVSRWVVYGGYNQQHNVFRSLLEMIPYHKDVARQYQLKPERARVGEFTTDQPLAKL